MFQFKQFSIEDSRSTMKVGTDGVLLGAWANAFKANNILDIGTGSGLIALMMAQKSNAKIHAIDIDKNSINQAIENFKKSPWENRLCAKDISLQEFIKNQNKKFDLIISNPPFFVDSLKSPNKNKTASKHNVHLDFQELASGIKHLLSKDGKACLILPKTESTEFINQMLIEILHLQKIVDIYPKPGKPINRCLLEFGFDKIHRDESNLTIRNLDNTYTSEYIRLTQDFYIRF